MKTKFKQLKPLCYIITPYTLDLENRITFSDPITRIKLYPRSDQFYINFLESFINDEQSHYYSKSETNIKNCIDVFIRLHLLEIKDDRIICKTDLIELWKEKYYQSFNWWEYYQQDLRDGVVSG